MVQARGLRKAHKLLLLVLPTGLARCNGSCSVVFFFFFSASLTTSRTTSCSRRSRVTQIFPTAKATVPFPPIKSCNIWVKNERRGRTRVSAVNDVTTAVVLDPAAPVEITWQIVVGTIAGVTPFVVAGVEFSKRIIAQRKCEVCGGSGLVLIEKEYCRCPGCGGFLPWQSWRRFFSG